MRRLYVTPVTILLATLLGSCSSRPPVRDEPIGKVDVKVLEEFDSRAAENDFYGAAESFIEFLKCCDDGRKTALIEELKRIHDVCVAEFDLNAQRLDAIEHTYSLINLLDGEVPGEELSSYRGRLDGYVSAYLDVDDKGVVELEKASRIMYLDRLSETRETDEALVKFFVERENAVLARTYLQRARETENGENGASSPLAGMESMIGGLETPLEDTDYNAIEAAVQSSVQVLVDKGIKTERGMSFPDQAIGSGIVIDPSGYILTNHHIIESTVDPAYEGYSRIYVITAQDRDARHVAKVVGYDVVFDLALLKVEQKLESRIRIGNSDELSQGEKVIAVGNPVGLTNTITSGVISSVDRPFLQIGGIIQIDAALNPGNSGGALINSDGYLVGITFAGLENFENLNFAIPSYHLLSVLHRLFEGGEIKRSWIGCSAVERDGKLVIEYIVPNSPAQISGLEAGDVVRKVNSIPVDSVYGMQERVATLNHPLIVNVTVERESEELTKKISLSKRPTYPAVYIYGRDAEENVITPLFGIILAREKDARKRTYIVTRTLQGSSAANAGITTGDELRLRDLEYDRAGKYFYLVMDLKSKRFGYLSKSVVLYQYVSISSFV